MLSTDSRFNHLLDWLRSELGLAIDRIEPASADASFRRYFRAFSEDASRIVMDAPPPQENVRPFVRVAGMLRDAGVQTPEIQAVDAERGFVLLGDFGCRNYLDALTAESAHALYADALAALLSLQQGVDPRTADLPGYDEHLLGKELGIFREWLLGHFLALELSQDEQRMLDNTWRLLIDSALEQPRVCVHRDYHSRNLMVTGQNNPGVLDFQDAVIGPITYDAVSLLRDCYIAWPAEQVYAWMESYRDALRQAGLIGAEGAARFRRWFDLMGMQRHLKATGIFARLHIRDGKPGYLKDIPRTLGYVVDVGHRYPELIEFAQFLERRVLPRLAEASMS